MHYLITPPNKLPVVSRDKVKTDKRDSLKLVTFLSKDLLRAINIPTHEILNFRQALRTREQLSRKRKRCINQVKGALLLQGITIDTPGLTQKSIEYISTLDLPDIIKASVMIHIDTYKFITKQIKEIELKAKESISSQYKQNYEILSSIPGVGPITVTAFLYEIGDWTRFKNKKQIATFIGLTPAEYSSGKHVRQGRITGQGNPRLRALLIVGFLVFNQ